MKMKFLSMRMEKVVLKTVTAAIAGLLVNTGTSGTITGKISDTTGFSTNATIIFYPLSTPLKIGDRIILTTPKTIYANSDGMFSIALEPGDYKVVAGTNSRDSFVISVPEGSGTNDWISLITGELTYAFPSSPVYEEKRFRGIAGGYPFLDSSGHVPPEQLGSGSNISNHFLRGDGVWTNISAANIASGTVSDDEFNSLDGIQQNIQQQLNARLHILNGFATNLAVNGFTATTDIRLLPSPGLQILTNTSMALWNDSNQKTALIIQNGILCAPVIMFFTSTNSITLTNTTAETSIVPAGIGATILPANSIATGKTLTIRMRGIYSSSSTSSTVIFKFKIGDTVFTTPALGYSTSQANKPIYIECNITFVSTGTNGGAILGGQFGSQTFTYVFASALNPQNQSLQIDTTRDNPISVTATHSRADASLTINLLTIQLAF